MKNFIILCALTLPFFTFACANGPGSYYEGELQITAQVSELHDEHEHHDEDHEEASSWHVEHVHLHVAGIQIRQDKNDFNHNLVEATSAELGDAPTELFHFDTVAGVEFDQVYLVLGDGGSDKNEHHDEDHEEEEEEEEEEEHEHEHELNSFSVEAIRESEIPCLVHIEIHEPGLKIPLPLMEPFTVTRDQIQSLALTIDVQHLLEGLPLDELCTESEKVHINEEENSSLYAQAVEHLPELFSTEFFPAASEPEESSGHDHGHTH